MSMLPVFRVSSSTTCSAPETTPNFETCLGKLAFVNPTNDGDGGESDDRPDVVVVVAEPATSEQSGSIAHDRKTRNPTHEWSSLDEFHAWRTKEEENDHIELRLCKTVRSNDLLYLETQTYSCSRRVVVVVGGRSKKNKDNVKARRSSNKRAGGCGCRVTIKTYHHVATVLGWYKSDHDHAMGEQTNSKKYTRRLRGPTRALVLELLRSGMDPKEVLTRAREEQCGEQQHERGRNVTAREIYRLQKIVEQEKTTGSTLSGQSSEELCDQSPTKVKVEAEAEEQVPHDVTEHQSLADADEDASAFDVQPEGCAISSITNSQTYTPSWPGPGGQMAVPYAVPYYGPMPHYVPPPISVYLPFPPYHLVLYPAHPAYFPSPSPPY